MEGRKLTRSTNAQLRKLIDYMSHNRAFANGSGEFRGPLGARKMATQWKELKDQLTELGPDKSIMKWKQTWRGLKRKARNNHAEASAACAIAGNSRHPRPSPLEMRHNIILNTIGQESLTATSSKESSIKDENREPKPKKLRQDNFTIVKICCINLVKNHDRSVTLFDDLAFRELIDLIPMTQSEKQTLTSQYIQSLLDDDKLADYKIDDTPEVIVDDEDDDDDDDDDDENPLEEIKGEIDPIPCTCGKDTDESMTRHTVECPASQSYWKFFKVSLDSATCQICYETLTWTKTATLKEHLNKMHPFVDFVDEDEESPKGLSSKVGSTNDIEVEEVYLDEAILKIEQTASAAKRRRKRAKTALNITGPITRENIAASLQRFKSLDSFGQYVASLLKLIPKDKCIKFQIQMVEQLLQEQAAAG